MKIAEPQKYNTSLFSRIPAHRIIYEEQFPETVREEEDEPLVNHRIFSSSPRILVVEDDLVLQFMFSEMLSSIGCKVDIADNGYEAIEMSNKNYDVILMDIKLPGIDGIATADMIRNKEGGKRNIIIAISAYADTLKKDEIKSSIDDVYVKPVLLDELICILKYWLPHLLLPEHMRN